MKSGISKPRTLRKTKDAPPENSEGSHFGTVEGRATRRILLIVMWLCILPFVLLRLYDYLHRTQP